ncbi:unnamed protein product [Prorocentrum cordatum]|uniref:Uncharacterized protein n=1 Tax=Prorocentrum cordatum TaxID=2364126 RepID=A0ABN9WGE5_9DINO|nr:unnamed protein product [Polarella glacialis]
MGATPHRVWSTCMSCGAHEYNGVLQVNSCKCWTCGRHVRIHKARPPKGDDSALVDTSANQPTAEGLLAQAAKMTNEPALKQVLHEQAARRAEGVWRQASFQFEQATSQVQRCKESLEKARAREAEAIRAIDAEVGRIRKAREAGAAAAAQAADAPEGAPLGGAAAAASGAGQRSRGVAAEGLAAPPAQPPMEPRGAAARAREPEAAAADEEGEQGCRMLFASTTALGKKSCARLNCNEVGDKCQRAGAAEDVGEFCFEPGGEEGPLARGFNFQPAARGESPALISRPAPRLTPAELVKGARGVKLGSFDAWAESQRDLSALEHASVDRFKDSHFIVKALRTAYLGVGFGGGKRQLRETARKRVVKGGIQHDKLSPPAACDTDGAASPGGGSQGVWAAIEEQLEDELHKAHATREHVELLATAEAAALRRRSGRASGCPPASCGQGQRSLCLHLLGRMTAQLLGQSSLQCYFQAVSVLDDSFVAVAGERPPEENHRVLARAAAAWLVAAKCEGHLVEGTGQAMQVVTLCASRSPRTRAAPQSSLTTSGGRSWGC